MFHRTHFLGMLTLSMIWLLAGIGLPGANAQPIVLPGDPQADIIRAQGQFMIDNQRAQLLQQEVRVKKMETRRKQLEEWMWQRDNLPTMNDERARADRETLRRSRENPPITEIWSAKSLNDLLANSKKIFLSEGATVVSATLSPEILAKLNLTSGKGNGNLGLVKSGKLTWPLLLRRSAFASERERIDRLVLTLVADAAKGNLEPEALDDANERLRKLETQLVNFARTQANKYVSPAQYLDARRYLSQLEDAFKALEEPNAGDYLNGKYVAQGKTVGDLVKYMKDNGLQFAPATPGSYEAYAAVYAAMRDYDISASPPEAPK